MENMSTEVIGLVCDTHKDDKDLIATILHYLYKTSSDGKMCAQINDIMTDMGYCLSCGNKVSTYEWKEVHDEIEGNPIEYRRAMFCHKCDKWEIEENRARVVE